MADRRDRGRLQVEAPGRRHGEAPPRQDRTEHDLGVRWLRLLGESGVLDHGGVLLGRADTACLGHVLPDHLCVAVLIPPLPSANRGWDTRPERCEGQEARTHGDDSSPHARRTVRAAAAERGPGQGRRQETDGGDHDAEVSEGVEREGGDAEEDAEEPEVRRLAALPRALEEAQEQHRQKGEPEEGAPGSHLSEELQVLVLRVLRRPGADGGVEPGKAQGVGAEARAGGGGEGTISKQDTKKKMKDGPPIFESEDKDVKLAVPEGWKTKE